MNKKQASTSDSHSEVSPDSLMNDFRGGSLFGVIVFTALVHVVLIGVFSIGYLRNELLGQDTKSLTEAERLDIAEQEAIKALGEIAKRHDVPEKDLSDRFAGKGKRSDTPTSSEPVLPKGNPLPNENPLGNEPDPTANEQEPGSDIERELQKKADGPNLPELPSLDDEDDLFK